MNTQGINRNRLEVGENVRTRYRALRPPRHIKPKRLGRRKRVTLIAAFRCDDGAVICADSQETVSIPDCGEYRARVTKIQPQEAGEYYIVIGGAGDGPLVDGFTNRLTEEVGSWEGGLDGPTAKSKLRSVLLDYHRNEVAVSQCVDKDLSFIVCLKPKDGEDVHLWELRGPNIKVVDEYSLVGWEDAIYMHEVERLYRPKIKVGQAVLLGVHLFTIAKATSNYIGGDTQVIVARSDGMWMPFNSIRTLEQRIAAVNHALADLTLACPDSSIPPDEFRDLLLKFEERLMKLREQVFKDVFIDSIVRPLCDEWQGDVYYQVPVDPRDPAGVSGPQVTITDDARNMLTLQFKRVVEAKEADALPSDSETSEDRQ